MWLTVLGMIFFLLGKSETVSRLRYKHKLIGMKSSDCKPKKESFHKFVDWVFIGGYSLQNVKHEPPKNKLT